MTRMEKFIKALEHTPTLFYLPESVIILDRESKEGYIEVANEEFVKEFDMEPGDDAFYKRFLFPQELNRRLDYHIIPKEQERIFRKELKEFIKTVQEKIF
ncbi:MAG: hypothetical protein GXZ11_07240 [Tissierellia bacterium]|nr:hypothetical protein [Tissierellia bacterium]